MAETEIGTPYKGKPTLATKQQAVKYYNEYGIPKCLEDLLNKMFLDNPNDIYGYMVRDRYCWKIRMGNGLSRLLQLRWFRYCASSKTSFNAIITWPSVQWTLCTLKLHQEICMVRRSLKDIPFHPASPANYAIICIHRNIFPLLSNPKIGIVPKIFEPKYMKCTVSRNPIDNTTFQTFNFYSFLYNSNENGLLMLIFY